jgi:hypothetical protein
MGEECPNYEELGFFCEAYIFSCTMIFSRRNIGFEANYKGHNQRYDEKL